VAPIGARMQQKGALPAVLPTFSGHFSWQMPLRHLNWERDGRESAMTCWQHDLQAKQKLQATRSRQSIQQACIQQAWTQAVGLPGPPQGT
jgi:hypothetical protein